MVPRQEDAPQTCDNRLQKSEAFNNGSSHAKYAPRLYFFCDSRPVHTQSG